jgi:hypothetical protein
VNIIVVKIGMFFQTDRAVIKNLALSQSDGKLNANQGAGNVEATLKI